jgi:hypothetical protein
MRRLNRRHTGYSCSIVNTSQVRIWISNAICRGLLVFGEFSWDERFLIVRFVDIDVIDDHHCLTFLFIIDILIKIRQIKFSFQYFSFHDRDFTKMLYVAFLCQYFNCRDSHSWESPLS